MAWIETASEEQADGLLARVYGAAIDRAGRVFNILKVQSQNPQALRNSIGFYTTIMLGESPLTRAQREMLATVVSKTNGCHY
jgi:alkylhydroperoxidase family enzyme